MKIIESEMLDRLSDRIVSVSWDAAKERFVIREECDGYFSAAFTPDELVALGRELIAAAVNKGE